MEQSFIKIKLVIAPASGRCFGHSRKTLSDKRPKAEMLNHVGITFTFDQGFQNALQGNASLLGACFPVLELDPAFVKPSSICIEAAGSSCPAT